MQYKVEVVDTSNNFVTESWYGEAANKEDALSLAKDALSLGDDIEARGYELRAKEHHDPIPPEGDVEEPDESAIAGFRERCEELAEMTATNGWRKRFWPEVKASLDTCKDKLCHKGLPSRQTHEIRGAIAEMQFRGFAELKKEDGSERGLIERVFRVVTEIQEIRNSMPLFTQRTGWEPIFDLKTGVLTIKEGKRAAKKKRTGRSRK